MATCISRSFLSFAVDANLGGNVSFFLPDTRQLVDFDQLSFLFVNALYMASATTATVGYGDMYAANQLERAIFLLMMISGVLFFGYIISSIAASQANADAARARFQEKLHAVVSFVEKEGLDKEMHDRVVNYYEYLWARTNGKRGRCLRRHVTSMHGLNILA